jgi:hypothetical protein
MRAAPPPDASHAWRAPAVTRQVPLAANPNSPGLAAGMPFESTTCHEAPRSWVAMIRNFPLTGSLIASPCLPPGHMAMQS